MLWYPKKYIEKYKSSYSSILLYNYLSSKKSLTNGMGLKIDLWMFLFKWDGAQLYRILVLKDNE